MYLSISIHHYDMAKRKTATRITRQRTPDESEPGTPSQHDDTESIARRSHAAQATSSGVMPRAPIMRGADFNWHELEMLGRFFYSQYFAHSDRWDDIPEEEQKRLQTEAYREPLEYFRAHPDHPLYNWFPFLLSERGCKPGIDQGEVPVLYPDECIGRWEWGIPGARFLARHAYRRKGETDNRMGEEELPETDSDDWDDGPPRQPRRREAHASSQPNLDNGRGAPLSQQADQRRGRGRRSASEQPRVTPATPAQQRLTVEEYDVASPNVEVFRPTNIPRAPSSGAPSPPGGGGFFSQTSPVVPTDSLTEVPEEIKAFCTEPERSFYNQRFRSTVWPVEPFSSSYINGGSSQTVREWALLRAKPALRRGSSQLIGSAIVETRAPRSRRPIWASKYQPPVTQPQQGEFTLQRACPNVNIDDAHRRLKVIDHYSATAEDESVRDFCAWFDKYRSYFSGLTRDLANYCLMSAVGGEFTYEVLNELREEVAEIPTASLALEIGRSVYSKLKIDPTEVAVMVRLNKDGCESDYHVYRRVADLHQCRTDKCAPDHFCSAMFYAFVAHAQRESKAKSNQLYYAFRQRYASLSAENNPAISLTASEIMNSMPLPQNTDDIRDFVTWLMDQVAIPVAEDLAPQFARYAKPKSELQADQQKRLNRFKRKGDQPDESRRPFKRGGSKSTTSAEIHTNKPSNKPGTPRVGAITCTHCSKPGHTEDRCWEKHPELRKERRSKRLSDENTEKTDDPAPSYRVGDGKEVMFDNAAPRGGRGRGRPNNGRGRAPGGRGRGRFFRNTDKAPEPRIASVASSSSSSSCSSTVTDLNEVTTEKRAAPKVVPKEEKAAPF